MSYSLQQAATDPSRPSLIRLAALRLRLLSHHFSKATFCSDYSGNVLHGFPEPTKPRRIQRIVQKITPPKIQNRARETNARPCGRIQPNIARWGFPNQFFCDSWAVGFWRTDHAHRHDGRGLDDCFASVRRIAVAPRRQGPGRSEVSRGLALFRGSQHHVAGSSGEIRTLEQRLETVLAIKPNRDSQFIPPRPASRRR
jgi:hypothetical protein